MAVRLSVTAVLLGLTLADIKGETNQLSSGKLFVSLFFGLFVLSCFCLSSLFFSTDLFFFVVGHHVAM